MAANESSKQQQNPQPDAAKDSPKENPPKEKKQVDPFWLRKHFPDPLAILALEVPSAQALFGNALIVFDTNALLAAYQVSDHSADHISTIYRTLAKDNRVFFPEQAMREFAKNRGVKLREAFEEVQKLTSNLPKAQPIDCPMLESLEAYSELAKVSASINELLVKYKNLVGSLRKSLTEWNWTDKITLLYREIITKHTLFTYGHSDHEFMEHLTNRYAHQVPPGFKDASKADSGMGDLAIWFAILKLAKEKNRDVLFVCNDTKIDWVYKSGDPKTTEYILGPRVELSLEFNQHTQRHFGIVTWSRFLEIAGAPPETVKDAESVAQKYIDFDFAPYDTLIRTRQAIEALLDALTEGPQDIGSGYAYYREDSFHISVSEFRNVCRLYISTIKQPIGQPHLKDAEGIIARLLDLNSRLKYMEVRMKHDGSQEQCELKAATDEAIHYLEQFLRATIPMM